jgi:signal transduction histidine kinase
LATIFRTGALIHTDKSRESQSTELSRAFSGFKTLFRTDGADRARLVAYIPAFIAILATLFIELGVAGIRDSAGVWLQLVEVAVVLGTVLAGTLWFGWHQSQITSRAMALLHQSEEERRAISAIGVGANWDLDLHRIFTRFSNDVTTLIDFDRLVITRARRDGRMQLEFVSGVKAPEDRVGDLIIPVNGSPDGLINPRDYGLQSQLTVPISAIDGTLTIRSREPDADTPYHADIMRQVIAQISPGISNAINYSESQARVAERTLLAEIGRAATHETDLDSILLVVSGALSHLLDVDHFGAVISATRPGEGRVVCWSTEGLNGLHTGDSVELWRLNESDGVITGRGSDVIAGDRSDLSNLEEDRIWMQAPLGEKSSPLGYLIVSKQANGILGEDEADTLERVANQIAPAIQNSKLTTELTKALEERRVTATIGRAANSALNLDRIFRVVAEETEQVVPSNRFVATLMESDKKTVRIAFVEGIDIEGKRVGDLIDPPTNQESSEMSRDVALICTVESTLEADDRFQSWIQVPLGQPEDPIGYLSYRTDVKDAYTSAHAEFIEGVARQVSPAIENARMFEKERQLRARLDEQNQELHQANAAKDTFLSTVSHELKTPLTIISGFVDLLMDDADTLDEDKLQVLQIVRKNSTHLATLINDVLDISRIASGNLRIDKEPFAVGELVEELRIGFEQLLQSREQNLIFQVPSAEIWIDADRGRIAQLITNLLSNAHKYSPPETEIRLSVAAEQENLLVTIEDQGIGISNEDQEKLFTAFFRVDSQIAREAGGTGLGLLIARSIAELHGGKLWLNSIEDQGTTVVFSIPGLVEKPVPSDLGPNEIPIFEQRSRLYPNTDWEDIGKTA